jgi:cyclic beta-1,2-glucan synthetase
VISGAGDPHRQELAMRALEEHLVREDARVLMLLTPPFDKTPRAGHQDTAGRSRERGQYTHGAIWSVIAFALLGDGDKAGALFSLLNPISHSATRADVRRYKTEPYAIAADVYSVAPHVGRGGWTWYTGSAAWMYRAGLEWILGFRVRGDFLEIDPCIPRSWPGFEISFFYGSARYEISVANPNGVSRGAPTRVPLVDDGAVHPVRIVLA